MTFSVYILRSETTSGYYIGHTSNLSHRLSQHNDDEYRGSKHTKRVKGPWVCVYTEEFATRGEAMKREKQLKNKKSSKHIEFLIRSRQSPEGVRD